MPAIEAELYQQRLQVLMEKRRLQEDITTKRRELEDERLRLQHLKTKTARTEWLLGQGQSLESESSETTPNGSTLYKTDIVSRLEAEISGLEREDRRLADEQADIFHRLKGPGVEIDKKPLAKNAVEETNEYTYTILSEEPNSSISPVGTPIGKDQSVACAMQIKVLKDEKTGEMKVISSTPLPPDSPFAQEGVRVYEDGRKAVYRVGAGNQSVDEEIGVLSSTQLEVLLDQARSGLSNEKQMESDLSLSRISGSPVSSQALSRGKVQSTEAILGVQTPDGGVSQLRIESPGDSEDQLSELASPDRPLTMVLLGYQPADGKESAPEMAELVVIGDDDGTAKPCEAAEGASTGGKPKRGGGPKCQCCSIM
uniref:paralemmin-1-like isoform X1 n=1 Tax=Myxine glutinosa TaxID=7769 RepID=UPI00358F7AD6